MEALIRERTALATAAVEFKVQIHMSQENIKEYEEQVCADFCDNFLLQIHFCDHASFGQFVCWSARTVFVTQ